AVRQFTMPTVPRSPFEPSGIETAAAPRYPLTTIAASPSRRGEGIGLTVMPPHDQISSPFARSWLRMRFVPLTITCVFPPNSAISGVFHELFSSRLAAHFVPPVAASRQYRVESAS